MVRWNGNASVEVSRRLIVPLKTAAVGRRRRHERTLPFVALGVQPESSAKCWKPVSSCAGGGTPLLVCGAEVRQGARGTVEVARTQKERRSPLLHHGKDPVSRLPFRGLRPEGYRLTLPPHSPQRLRLDQRKHHSSCRTRLTRNLEQG